MHLKRQDKRQVFGNQKAKWPMGSAHHIGEIPGFFGEHLRSGNIVFRQTRKHRRDRLRFRGFDLYRITIAEMTIVPEITNHHMRIPDG